MTSSGGRSLIGYLGLVVVPVLIAVSVGSWRLSEHGDLLTFDRIRREVDASSYLLVQAMGQTQRDLAMRAPVMEVASPLDPAVQRALQGDTVAGLSSTNQSLELTVVVADSSGVVRMIREPFHPLFLDVLPGITDLGVSIYLSGRRSATSMPPLGPPSLDDGTLRRLASAGTAIRYEATDVRGVIAGVRGRPGTEPELVLLIGQPDGAPGGRWLPTLLPILGIVLFLALTAAWTMMRSASTAEQETSFAQTALVALIPVLAGAVILMAFDRGFRGEVVEAGTLELSQATVKARQLQLPMSPALIKRATGFEVATIDPEGMEGTTVVNDELIGELSLLKLPPPNWMSSGVVTTTSGPALYEIVRVGTDRGLVLIRTDLSERMAALRRSLLWTSAIMILPAILFLAIGGLQRPPTGLPPVRPSSR